MREPPSTSTVLGSKLIELTWTLPHSHRLDGVFLHMSKGKPYAEKNHIAGTQPETMAVLVGVFRGQPPVPGPLLVCSCWVLQGVGVSAVGMASVWEQWLLCGSRFWVDGGAQHCCGAFGLPGGGYHGS